MQNHILLYELFHLPYLLGLAARSIACHCVCEDLPCHHPNKSHAMRYLWRHARFRRNANFVICQTENIVGCASVNSI